MGEAQKPTTDEREARTAPQTSKVGLSDKGRGNSPCFQYITEGEPLILRLISNLSWVFVVVVIFTPQRPAWFTDILLVLTALSIFATLMDLRNWYKRTGT